MVLVLLSVSVSERAGLSFKRALWILNLDQSKPQLGV